LAVIDSLHRQLALRAIRYANVRFGIPAYTVRKGGNPVLLF